MTLTTENTLLLSLADIARVAQVQRPVVSMWRKRIASGDLPFPEPVAAVRGEDRFDARQVVEHLELTRRGNNPQVRDDVAAFAELRAVSRLGEATLVDGLTALLCLRVISGELLGHLSATELLDRAHVADPADTLLAGEMVALGEDLQALAAHADALADASYSPARAFELLLRRERHLLPGHSVRLHDDALRLVALVAKGLADSAELASPVFIDPTDGGSDLLMSVATAYGEAPTPGVITGAQTSRAARLARRRLRGHDIYQVTKPIDTDVITESNGELVTVAQFPPPGQPGTSDLEILDAIDDIVVQMDDRQRAVLIGPASALTDRPATGEVSLARTGILRSDRVRAVVRLPQGLMPQASRRAVALWVLGPAAPHIPIDRRWTVLADLSNTRLTEAVVSNLVSDVAGAMGDEATVRAHAFRFGTRTPTSALIAGQGALLGRVAHAPRRTDDGADLAVRINGLIASLEPTPLASLRTEVRAGASYPSGDRATFTLGDAVRRKHCRILPGNRMDPADLNASSGAAVIGSAELLAQLPLDQRRVDRLTFGASYPAGRYTDPGDIVFCTSPRVSAMVDAHGGSVVVAPARVLRIDTSNPGGLLPHLLAADIRSVDPGAKRWTLWGLRRAATDQYEVLNGALADIERERLAARQRLAHLDALAATIAEGVTANTITISRASTKPRQDDEAASHHHSGTRGRPSPTCP